MPGKEGAGEGVRRRLFDDVPAPIVVLRKAGVVVGVLSVAGVNWSPRG